MTLSQVIKYLETTELDIQNANAALFFCDLAYSSYAGSYVIHGINFAPIFCYLSFYQRDSFYQIISEEKINKVADKIYFDFLKNPSSLDKKIADHSALSARLDMVWQKYQLASKPEITDKKLLAIFQELMDISVKWWQYSVIGEDHGKIIETRVVSYFKNKHNITENRAQEIVNILSHPAKQAIFNLERSSFLNLCLIFLEDKKLKYNLTRNDFQFLLNHKKVKQKIADYLKEYFWIKTSFYRVKPITPRLLLKDIKKELKQASAARIKRELREINSNFNKINKQKSGLLKKLKLSSQDKKMVSFAQKVIYWGDLRKIGMMRQVYYLLTFLEDIARRRHFDYHELSLYNYNEVIAFLSSGKRLSKKEINLRNKDIILAFEQNKKRKFFYGNDAVKIFETAIQVEKNQEIAGVVASKGVEKKIIGKVRVILSPKKEKISRGEILVTSMTRIEFVPLMRRAKAIITNEGGMACHAAIVSRELGIPCIVGTKHATHVFRDGDKIEIDINTGIIKKL